MFLEYAENIVQLMACLIALLFCLFQYISGKQKGWVYATAVFLCSLMSSYYWTAYLVIMGDYPNVSNLFSYMGWNVAFVFLLILVLHMRCAESRRFFHPLMLLPVPLNAWQLTLYLQYGGVLNNLIQVSVGNPGQGFVDPLQVPNHQPVHQRSGGRLGSGALRAHRVALHQGLRGL